MGALTSSWSSRRRADEGWIVIVLAVATLVVAAAVVVGALWLQRGPSPPSVSGAVDRFRASATSAASKAALQPRPGVYLYAGTGDEHLSFLSTGQSQDGSLPGTVTVGADGCWTFAIDYNSFHRQAWSRCATDGRLVETGGATDQKFDFGVFSQSEHTTVACNPPIVLVDSTSVAGATGPIRCDGHSQTTNSDQRQRGRITFVGRTSVMVGGTGVAALHYREDFTISGGQKGSTHESAWIAADNGLPLREERTITVVSPAPAPINEATYHEHGVWRLTSLTPRM